MSIRKRGKYFQIDFHNLDKKRVRLNFKTHEEALKIHDALLGQNDDLLKIIFHINDIAKAGIWGSISFNDKKNKVEIDVTKFIMEFQTLQLITIGREMKITNKAIKKLRRAYEPNHTDVYGKQQPHEENFEGRV